VESVGTRETDRQFAGSIPETYDRFLGPLLSEPYARDLAARLADLAPTRVLETAAGTGVATRALARALPAGTAIVATDLNRPMLDLAAARLETAEVTWQQADALALPFADGTFDAVACQFGAMFFPDKAAAYREARRVLRRGGRFVLSVWDRIESNELAQVVDEAVAAQFPEDPPRFLARVPHGYHDADAIIDELRAAGFVEVAVETVARRGRAPSPRHAAVGLCQGTPLRAEIEARAPGRLGGVTDEAARAVAARFGDGPVDSGMQAHVIVATR
jgi:ubiquinone/menaquinone biosynthesis C-methylase UbiE